MKLFFAVFLSSLITLPACAGVNNLVSVEIINQPSKTWRFSAVNASPKGESVRVKGHIIADRSFGLPKGHVDIAAYSPEGELVVATTTHYKPRMLRYRAGRKGKVRFSTNIVDAPPQNSAIKIAFHSSNPSVKANSDHHNTAIQ